MKKLTVIIVVVILAIHIFIQSGVIESLVLFLIAGIVPGTRYALSPSVMLLSIIAVVWLLLLHFTSHTLLNSLSIRKLAKAHLEREQRKPKRRYSII